MTRARAVVLLFIIVIAGAIAFLPATRDELSWWWADSHDHAADFVTYLMAWPNGRHVADARLKYKQRRWIEIEQALIHQAYQDASHSSPEADAEYRKEKRLRQDTFFWKSAAKSDTLESYGDYLEQYPKGQFVHQARARINDLNHGSQSVPAQSSPPPQ